jgi:hypothetical protein
MEALRSADGSVMAHGFTPLRLPALAFCPVVPAGRLSLCLHPQMRAGWAEEMGHQGPSESLRYVAGGSPKNGGKSVGTDVT